MASSAYPVSLRGNHALENQSTLWYGMHAHAIRAPASDILAYCCAHSCKFQLHIITRTNNPPTYRYLNLQHQQVGTIDHNICLIYNGIQIGLARRYTYLHEGSSCCLGVGMYMREGRNGMGDHDFVQFVNVVAGTKSLMAFRTGANCCNGYKYNRSITFHRQWQDVL